MDGWADFLELPELKDPKFKTAAGRIQNRDELRALIVGKLAGWKSHEFFRTAMDKRFVVGVVQSPQEVLDCTHLAERGSFVAIEHPEVGVLRYPGPGFLLDGHNPMERSRPAPRLGQHNGEVYSGRLGLSQEEMAGLAAAGIV